MAIIPSGDKLSNARIMRPGDKLVLGYAHPVSDADAATIKSKVAEKLPGVEIVIISAITHMAVYEPGYSEQPSDDQIAGWVMNNPQEFAAWVKKKNRMMGITWPDDGGKRFTEHLRRNIRRKD